jgi:hypothetical protein
MFNWLHQEILHVYTLWEMDMDEKFTYFYNITENLLKWIEEKLLFKILQFYFFSIYVYVFQVSYMKYLKLHISRKN